MPLDGAAFSFALEVGQHFVDQPAQRSGLAFQFLTADPRVAKRIKRGAAATAVDYLELRSARAAMIGQFETKATDYDALLLPTLPVIAPLLELSRVPRIFADPVMNIALRAPNMTWNQPADLTEPDREPGVATRAIAQLLRLGSAVRHAAANETARCRDIVFLTNAHDRTVSTAPALDFARMWSARGGKVQVYQLADSFKLRHDIVDPRQTWAKPKIVYPYHYRGQNLDEFANALKGTGIDVRIRDWYAPGPAGK